MYSIVLVTALTAGTAAPDLGWKSQSCYGACYGGCYGVCYGCSGCWGCTGGYGCWGCSGCSGCFGSCYGGCYGGCYGCHGGWNCFGCHGCSGCSGYWGCSGCHGCSGCWGGTGCYSCWGCSGCSGCFGSCYGGCIGCYGAPAHGPVIIGSASNYSKATNGIALATPSNTQATKLPATVVIKANSDVVIKVNGQLTSRKNETEAFKTPELQVGKVYSYDIVAEATRDGQKVTTSKRVLVRAGQETEVNFGDVTAVAETPKVENAKPENARVTVLLPEGGKLFVDGKEYGSQAKQTFSTPKLTSGQVYFYTLKVEVQASNNAEARSKRVEVSAGGDVTVDFRSMFVTNNR